MEAVHVRNATRLKEVIEEHGWPGRRLVGEDAANAAWMILNHAIGDPAFQRSGLELVREAALRADVDPVQVATLDDRIRAFEGRPQLYGTQFDWAANGEMSPYRIEDREHIDERRATIGLGPLSEHIAVMREAVAASNDRAPADHEARRREFEAWAQRVGWRK
jgi:hypothetical protein